MSAADKDKTEKPTPKKKREARREGRVARSQDLVPWAMVLVVTTMLPGTFTRGRLVAADAVSGITRVIAEPEPGRALAELSHAFRGVLGVVLPLMLTLCAVAVVGNLAQTGFMFTTKPLKPTFTRLNPLQGIKRLVSVRSAWETAKQLVKLVIIAAVTIPVVRSTVEDLAAMPRPLWDTVGMLGITSLRLVRNVALTSLVIAAADYVYQRKHVAKSLKMSKQEIKEEYKQAEGNGEVKQKIKSLQAAASRNRMMAAIADANVVVVNPVHVAVALRYVPGMGAPRVVAKGAGLVAERIRDEADRRAVPIVESVPLARALHKACDLEDEVPVELYEGVARLLAFVQRLSASRPLGGGFHRLAEPVAAYR